MAFYDELAIYYDEIFPLKEDILTCLKSYIDSGKVLDVGCSTGSYANALSEDSKVFVKGIDLNDEMIRLARKSVGSAKFDIQNVIDFNEHKTYDFIYSIGNTLVHLDNIDEIKDVLKKLMHGLKKKGKLLIQIVNYGRIFRDSISDLPTIETDNVKFTRTYQLQDGKVKFHTVIKTKLHKASSTVTLYPLTKAEIEMIAEDLGVKVQFFGSFKKEPFTNDSFHLIAEFR